MNESRINYVIDSLSKQLIDHAPISKDKCLESLMIIKMLQVENQMLRSFINDKISDCLVSSQCVGTDTRRFEDDEC